MVNDSNNLEKRWSTLSFIYMHRSTQGTEHRLEAYAVWTFAEDHIGNFVPKAGRLNGSRLRLDANIPFNRKYLGFLKRHELGCEDKYLWGLTRD
jgi:hypothetical protein